MPMAYPWLICPPQPHSYPVRVAQVRVAFCNPHRGCGYVMRCCTTGAPPALPAVNEILPFPGNVMVRFCARGGGVCGLRGFFPVRGNISIAAGNADGIPVVNMSAPTPFLPSKGCTGSCGILQPASGLWICYEVLHHGCTSGATRG